MRKSSLRIFACPALSRLRDSAGDTLVEALVALLIAALGATLLAIMVTTSVNISASSQEAFSRLYQEERSFVPIASKKATLQVKNSDSSFQVDAEIQIYQSSNKEFTRYELLGNDGDAS